MSKIRDKIIEIEHLLVGGLDAKTISKRLDVPINWVINIERKLFK